MICYAIISHLLFKCHSIIIISEISRKKEQGGNSMSTLGIISEYNPYHKGHEYLLRTALEMTGASHSVSVMSGNFSQQGLPMVKDKYLRAAAATASGIDLVFELPTVFATGAAGDFAGGAVLLLSSLPSMEYLCFGVETPDPSFFGEVAECCVEEPEVFRKTLRDRLKAGCSFPSAREDALAAALGDVIRQPLRSPNNILALEYVTAMKRLNCRLRPCFIKRSSDYHSGVSASATSIRNHILALTSSEKADEIPDYLKEVLPPGSSGQYLASEGGLLLSPEGLMPYLSAKLMELPEEPEDGLLPMDMTPEIYHRLRKTELPTDYPTLILSLKKKNETMGRITRSLLHLILGIRQNDRVPLTAVSAEQLYLNLLSARSDSTTLLRDTGSVTVITKKSSFHPDAPLGKRLWELDLRASFLYDQLYFDTFKVRLPSELRRTPVIV